MGNDVGVKVASTSVGKVVPVGGGVSVVGRAGGVGEEQETRRKMKVERRQRETTEGDMERILSHLLLRYPPGCVRRIQRTIKSPSLQNLMNCLR